MSDIFQHIKQKLAYLRDHEDYDVTDADQARVAQVHRSSKYRYTLSTPATEAQVAAFEAEHGIQLPDDYRRFLLEVGTGGAGPGYDLLSPFDDMVTLENYHQYQKGMAVIGDLRQPFPFIGANTIDIVNDLIEKAIEQAGTRGMENLMLAGHLMVGYSGCQCWNLLIISGEARGQLWDMDGIYVPVRPDAAKFSMQADRTPAGDARVTFTQWYEAWLDEEIASARTHWTKRGRTVPPLIFTENESLHG